MKTREEISKVCDEFKRFVLDAMEDDMHVDFPDHLSFLQACMGFFTSPDDDDITEEDKERALAYSPEEVSK